MAVTSYIHFTISVFMMVVMFCFSWCDTTVVCFSFACHSWTKSHCSWRYVLMYMYMYTVHILCVYVYCIWPIKYFVYEIFSSFVEILYISAICGLWGYTLSNIITECYCHSISGFHPEKFCWGGSCMQKKCWRGSRKLAFIVPNQSDPQQLIFWEGG